jgi:ATP-dependent helicase/nuclease subunit B
VPDSDRDADSQAPFVPAESDLVPQPELPAESASVAPDGGASIDDPIPIVEGSVRAPWRWEDLIVEASVIGGRDRWRRRLDGLEEEFHTKLTEVEDDTTGAYQKRRLLDLGHLKRVALPIINALDILPRGANWREWLDALKALTNLAIRDRDPVLATLAELVNAPAIGSSSQSDY